MKVTARCASRKCENGIRSREQEREEHELAESCGHKKPESLEAETVNAQQKILLCHETHQVVYLKSHVQKPQNQKNNREKYLHH